MEQNSSFLFDIRTAQGSWEIENEKDLDTFLEELSCLSFQPLKHETVSDSPQKKGEIYVFSTACDIGLQSFLLSCNPRPITLFISQPENLTEAKDQSTGLWGSFSSLFKKSENSRETNTEILYLADFDSKGCTAPAGWLVRKKIKPLGVQVNKMEVNYAQVAFARSTKSNPLNTPAEGKPTEVKV
jgi:hypothetical protein